MKNPSKFDVSGFGITTLDYICIVDKLANYRKHTTIEDVKFFGGGCVSTALVALNRLGGTSAFITSLGNDWAGKEVLQGLKEENIDCSAISIHEKQLTTFSFIQVSKKEGKRAIAFFPGSCRKLKFDKEAKNIIKKSKILLLDGLIQFEELKAARFAGENNIKIMLDCNVFNDETKNLLPYTDYLITSESFLYDYSKTKDINQALHSLYEDYKPEILVTTLGKRGSVTLINNQVKYVDIFDVKVRDTTGCGDVYHGAFLYGILRGWKIIDIMTFSTAVSSIKSMYYGGRAGIPDFEKTLKFLKSYGVDINRFL
jgi:ribokinase